jgi:ring hydroxylating enzyme alpha subunit
MKAARYLNWRINRQVNQEDTALINSVQQGMTSSSYDVGPLGSTEVCLRSFACRYRALMPVTRERTAPPPGWSKRSS